METITTDTLSKRILEAAYEQVALLDITAWRTTEPVPFSQKTRGEELHLGYGDVWGKALFDCAWFRFRTDIPPGSEGQLAVRIDINGELCLVDDRGMPVRGLTNVSSSGGNKPYGPAKIIYRLPNTRSQPGRLELWGDAGFNDLFGNIRNGGRIERAELCRIRDDVRALLYDLDVVEELGTLFPDEKFLKTLTSVRSEIERLLSPELGNAPLRPESVVAARETLRPWLIQKGERPSLEISAIGHAHLDLAWLWPIRETIRKGARTFANALYTMQAYPEYIFGASQVQLFAWMKDLYPDLYVQIQEKVAQGRIELQSPAWVESDANIPSGEALVRQVLVGRKFLREEFGMIPQYGWLPDTFGFNGQLPQIFRKAELAYFVTYKIFSSRFQKFPYHAFVWEGIDGSTVLTHVLSEGTYNSEATLTSLARVRKNYAQRDVSHHALIAFGIGDGGAGPDAEHLERLRREKHLGDLPGVRIQRVDEFLHEWEKDAAAFPRWNGELYLHFHQGTYTTQAATKRGNRLSEIGLRELEWGALLAQRFACIPYPAAELEQLWREVLLYQFHDILAGSSIPRVHEECNARYDDILERLKQMTSERYVALANGVDAPGSHVVFNSLPWARREWVCVEDTWQHIDVPGLGWAIPSSAVPLPKTLRAENGLLENEFLRARFDNDGLLVSLVNTLTGEEAIAPNARANDLLVFEDTGDAWDFTVDRETNTWVYLDLEPRRPTLVHAEFKLEGPRAVVQQTRRVGNSEIRQRIFLTAGSKQLEFETEIDWQEKKSVLRARFPVNVTADTARCEIPFGSIARSTHNETPLERAQVEVPAQQWVDLSQADRGVTLLNDCKYGYRLKGNTIDLDVLRSARYPNTDRENPVYTDLGKHVLRYAILPHGGDFSEKDSTQAARAFNIPLSVVKRTAKGKTSSIPRTAFTIDNPAIDVSAIKPAENGTGIVVRFINTERISVRARIHPGVLGRTITHTNLVETPIAPVTRDADGAFEVSFGPFAIETFLLAD